jgi:hypothetical protein
MNPDRDRLKLLVKCEPFPTSTDGKLQLAVEATINDIAVTTWDDLPVDMDAMKASSICAGEYYLWNCTCGHPSCAGLRQGILVEHENEAIIWRNPPSTGKGRFLLQNFGELVFDKSAYVRTVQEAMKEMKRQAYWHRDQGLNLVFLLRSEEEVFWRGEDRGPSDSKRKKGR